MTSFTKTAIKQVAVRKAARQVKQEIEKAGLDNLEILADAGKSIVQVILQAGSAQEKARIRRDLNALLQLGITIDMVLTEVVRQMPGLAPIMEGKDNYRKSEITNLYAFAKGG